MTQKPGTKKYTLVTVLEDNDYAYNMQLNFQ
jgi:hypothetical protein